MTIDELQELSRLHFVQAVVASWVVYRTLTQETGVCILLRKKSSNYLKLFYYYYNIILTLSLPIIFPFLFSFPVTV